MRFFDGYRGTKITMLLGIVSEGCKRNFRPEIRKTFIEGNKTKSLPLFGQRLEQVWEPLYEMKQHCNKNQQDPNNRKHASVYVTACLQVDSVSNYQRWPESYFKTPTRFLFQSFWIRIRARNFFKFENPTSIQTPATIDSTQIQQCLYLSNDIYEI